MTPQRDGSVLYLHLDAPATNNAFDARAAATLTQAIRDKSIVLIVLKSQGRIFCSGGDLKEQRQFKTKAQGLQYHRRIRASLQALARHPALKIACVQGDCFGGGIELLSCFDQILADRHVYFGMWQRKMGLSYGWGGYGRLQNRMKVSILKTWLMEGDLKPASWALREGLVDGLLNSHEQTQLVKKWVERLGQNAGESLKILKTLPQNEINAFEDLWWSDSHRQKLKPGPRAK